MNTGGVRHPSTDVQIIAVVLVLSFFCFFLVNCFFSLLFKYKLFGKF